MARRKNSTGRPPGRPRYPTKLTPSTIIQICEGIRSCLPLEDCANRGGVTFQTFRTWYKAGSAEYVRRVKNPKREQEWPRLTPADVEGLAALPAGALPDTINDGERLFLCFFEAVTRANADAKSFVIGGIVQAGVPHTKRTVTTSTRDIVLGDKVVTLTEKTVREEEGAYDVRALQWIAERRWPEDFALTLQTMDIDPASLPDDVVDAIADGQKPARALRGHRPEESVGIVVEDDDAA